MLISSKSRRTHVYCMSVATVCCCFCEQYFMTLCDEYNISLYHSRKLQQNLYKGTTGTIVNCPVYGARCPYFRGFKCTHVNAKDSNGVEQGVSC